MRVLIWILSLAVAALTLAFILIAPPDSIVDEGQNDPSSPLHAIVQAKPPADPATHSGDPTKQLTGSTGAAAGIAFLAMGSTVSHAVIDSQACLAGTASAAQPARTAIHRWTDGKGIVHFSDQAPIGPAQGYRKIDVQGQPAIVVKARGYDVNLPEDLVQNSISSAQAIDRILRGTLGVEGDPGLVLDVEFIAAADAWIARAGNPAMANSAGTYSPQGRTIRIRYQDDEKTNFIILRHEIAHALVHERIGRLPTAINEGIAGYFEHMTVTGMGAQVSIAESAHSLGSARIEGDGQAELVDLLARDGVDFYAEGQQKRYLRAYTLIAMLMDSGPGRAALAAVLAAQRGQPCRSVKAEAILDSRYPGGLAALARDWVTWLGNPPRSVRSW